MHAQELGGLSCAGVRGVLKCETVSHSTGFRENIRKNPSPETKIRPERSRVQSLSACVAPSVLAGTPEDFGARNVSGVLLAFNQNSWMSRLSCAKS